MTTNEIPLAQEIGRVPSMVVPLDAREERRFQDLEEESVMVDIHQHPFVCPKEYREESRRYRSSERRESQQEPAQEGATVRRASRLPGQ